MTSGRTVSAAAGAALLIAAGSLLIYGWEPAGLSSAARNTARFSGIVFALALVARSRRFQRLFSARWSLFFAFVAAHSVHYTAVLTLAILDATHDLHQLKLISIAALTFGSGLLLLAALTAGTAANPFRSRVHTAFFYLLGIIFLLAFGSRALHASPSGMVLLVVLCAFMARAWPLPRSSAAAA